MQLVKIGRAASVEDFRTILLRGGTGHVFDLYLVHHSASPQAAPPDLIDVHVLGLSTRAEDQVVDDTTAFLLADMFTSDQIFALGSFHQAIITSGRTEGFMGQTITFLKPYTVPYLAWMFLASTGQSILMATEVYFEQRRASQQEIADLVVEAGGRSRT